MQTIFKSEMLARCEILADALDETIAELRLIDASDMIAYIRAGQWANISDLVQSSAELSFEDGVVSFGYGGDYELDWDAAPSIALDMEFQTRELTAFFTLTMGPSASAIRIKDVMFTSTPTDESDATLIFARVLRNARRVNALSRRDGFGG
jgi:hypothetical protein